MVVILPCYIRCRYPFVQYSLTEFDNQTILAFFGVSMGAPLLPTARQVVQIWRAPSHQEDFAAWFLQVWIRS